MEMIDELISFETAKLAKEREFDIKTRPQFFFFAKEDGTEETRLLQGIRLLRPTQSLLQRWLREKHNIIIEIKMFTTIPDYRFRIWVNPEKGKNCSNIQSEEIFISYEKALEKGLQEGLKLIEL